MANICQLCYMLGTTIKCFYAATYLVLTKTIGVLWCSCSSLHFLASFAVSLALWLATASRIWEKWSMPLLKAEWLNVSCSFSVVSSPKSTTRIYYLKKSDYIEVAWHRATKGKYPEFLSLLRLDRPNSYQTQYRQKISFYCTKPHRFLGSLLCSTTYITLMDKSWGSYCYYIHSIDEDTEIQLD